MFLDEYPEIPYDTLRYTCGESNYGGKVTDAHDRHTLMTILDDYYTDRILDVSNQIRSLEARRDTGSLTPWFSVGFTASAWNAKSIEWLADRPARSWPPQDSYKLSPSGIYFAPKMTSFDGYLEYINSLPLIAQPEVFGLHENADITKDLQETNQLLDSLMLTQSRDASGGGKSFEDTIREVAEDILARLPSNFDIEAAINKYPVDYNNSMNTVLVQELERFNRLLVVIRSSLINLGKAVKGLALMSSELDQVGRALYDGKVPALWLKKSFASLKPLGPYIKELLERVRFFQSWVDDGAPTVFWISGFFFTQARIPWRRTACARGLCHPHRQPACRIATP